MKKRSLLLRLFLTASVLAVSQPQTITLSGADLEDAMVRQTPRPGYEAWAATNYASAAGITAIAWTGGGYNMFYRNFFYLNTSSIPRNATITSATLYLYSDPTRTDPNAAEGNSQLSGTNGFYLEKVTQLWDVSTEEVRAFIGSDEYKQHKELTLKFRLLTMKHSSSAILRFAKS